MNIFSIFKPAPHITRISHEYVDSMYKKFRCRNFCAIFIAYAGYYLLRNNFSLAIPFLLQESTFTKTQLGAVLSILSLAYGISKFVMGNLSDRSNPRYFIATGLIISIIINIAFSVIPANLLLMYILMFINGWAQGMGGPACFRTIAHWFSLNERGKMTALWSVSHNLGAALLGALAAFTTVYFGWKSIFYIPPIIVTIITLIVLIIMRDTPQSVGLGPIEEYKTNCNFNHNVLKNDVETEKELSGKEILFKYVLINKNVWFLSVAALFIYTIRYGVLAWVPSYLSEVRHIEVAYSYFGQVIYECAGIAGILLSGYISDKLFKNKRALLSILYLCIVFLGILLYWFGTGIMIHLALLIIGMFIYGPIALIGIQILDTIPKKAVGTTVGLVGLFAYVGGSTAASSGMGYVVDSFGWNGGFSMLLISCILAILCLSMTLISSKKVN